MRKILLTIALAVAASGSAFASPETEAMAPVKQFVNGFNKGDMKAVVAAAEADMNIVDDFAPHEWHGKGAMAKWLHDYDVDAKKQSIKDGIVTIGTPWRVDVTGDRAYAVIPAEYAYKMRGKPVKETGAVLTVALHKGSGGWKITAWTWSKH